MDARELGRDRIRRHRCERNGPQADVGVLRQSAEPRRAAPPRRSPATRGSEFRWSSSASAQLRDAAVRSRLVPSRHGRGRAMIGDQSGPPPVGIVPALRRSLTSEGSGCRMTGTSGTVESTGSTRTGSTASGEVPRSSGPRSSSASPTADGRGRPVGGLIRGDLGRRAGLRGRPASDAGIPSEVAFFASYRDRPSRHWPRRLGA